MGVNCPSLEALDLTTTGNFVPHTTSLEKKRQVKGLENGKTQGKEKERLEELWKKYRVNDSKEEGE
jgi:hypothetical protein